MLSEHAIRTTTDFKAAVAKLTVMENSDGAFSKEDIRLQGERVADLEASIRTALLRSF